MKISYYIPKGKKGYSSFIKNEISSVSNIKDLQTRTSVLKGLTKISASAQDGYCYFWDDDENVLQTFPYVGNISKYFCGKKFDFEPLDYLGNKSRYMLVVLDTKEVIIGILDGKKIVPLYKDNSGIASKHNEGGQSAQRFERLREGQIKGWFKKIGQKIWDIYNKEK
jgi:peptide subunit release factor 1 (eRF1)